MNKKSITINNKMVDIYLSSKNDNLPVIVLNSYLRDGEKIYNECLKENISNFVLVCISNLDWNNDLTPWKSFPLFKEDSEYLGNGDRYIKELENIILPKINKYLESINKKVSYYALAGYSLAGLFALYSGYNTNLFAKIICVSSSFWYPNFLEYVLENKINNSVNKIYFSLGKKEKESKNKILCKVEDNTKKIYEHLKNDITVIYEENRGGHFNNSEERIVKGIKWILK